jgi:hypothetical protein
MPAKEGSRSRLHHQTRAPSHCQGHCSLHDTQLHTWRLGSATGKGEGEGHEGADTRLRSGVPRDPSTNKDNMISSEAFAPPLFKARRTGDTGADLRGATFPSPRADCQALHRST